MTWLAWLLASSWKAEVTRDFQGLAVGKTVPPGWERLVKAGSGWHADSLSLSTLATVNMRKPAHWL